jgi:hypothetical protein
MNYTKYGYRPKLTGIPKKEFENTIPLNEAPSEIYYSNFSALYHNFFAADRYRKKFDALIESQENARLFYVYFPFLVEIFFICF